MNQDRVLLDANILYSFPLRDLFLQLAVQGIFHVYWTDGIQQEWMQALKRNNPRLSLERLQRTQNTMNAAFPNATVSGYEAWTYRLNLPDANDRHVLAAAIIGRCGALITKNLKDSPASSLDSFGVLAQHPDGFLTSIFPKNTHGFCTAVQTIRHRLQSSPLTAAEYLSILEAQGLQKTIHRLKPYADLL